MIVQYENPLIRWVKARVAANSNANFLVWGRPGSGKTWSSLSLAVEFAKALGTEFDVEKHCVFSIRELIELINGGTLKPGSVIVYDEAGIDADSQKWQSAVARALKYCMETYRHRRYLVLFTTPYPDFLLGSAKLLIDCEMEMMSINRSEGTAIIKPLFNQYNPHMKKMYRRFLRAQTDKGSRRVKRILVRKPSKDITKKYEAQKLAYTTWLYEKKILPMLEGIADKPTKPQRKAICKRCKFTWTPHNQEAPTLGRCGKCAWKETAWVDQYVEEQVMK